MFRKSLSTAVIAMLMAASAQAAHLSNIQGTVLVNHGNGFRPALDGSEVAAGDRVRAANGSANIIYDNGCATRVGPNQVIAVLSAPACNGSPKDGIVDTGPSNDTLIVGGLAIAGGVGLAVALSQNNNNPASP